MPQDIPLEASDTLAFTPECLKDIDDAPVFTLRAATTRDKRFQRRLINELGLTLHGTDAIRAEILAGLKALWSPEAFEEWSPVVTALWEARDQFELQQKDDPDLVWSYDAEVERAVDDLVRKVRKAWSPLGVKLADNADFNDLIAPVLACVVLDRWTGLDVPRKVESGYVTLECVEAVADALGKIEEANGLPEGIAWLQLFTACSRRMNLTEEEAGNSESPSPSNPSPAPSKAKSTSASDGKSPASAPSTETPATS